MKRDRNMKERVISMRTFHYETIPENLKYYRKLENLTQERVAGLLGISRQAYNHYESGRVSPDVNVLFALSEMYEISIESFFRREEPRGREILEELENSSHRVSDFMEYYGKKDNMIKYRALTREEKELLFYFKNVGSEARKEFLLTLFLKYVMQSKDAER